ncbi:MAG: PHP domain-containing protein [Halobacteria archaeon]
MVDPTDRAEIVALLNEFADRLEAKDVDYKPRSYRRAAESLYESPSAMLRNPREIDDVGDAIAGKIEEYLEKRGIEELEELREEMPVNIQEVTEVEGVGPKTAGILYRNLDVRNLDDLEKAAEKNRIRNVKGFGPRTEEKILEGIGFAREKKQSTRLSKAMEVAGNAVEKLEKIPDVEEVGVSGEVRRRREAVETIDLVVSTENPESIVDYLSDFGMVRGQEKIDQDTKDNGEGDTYRFGLTGADADLVVQVTGENFVLERWRTTGDAKHVREVESMGTNAGFLDPSSVKLEKDVYSGLGMEYVEPELREGRGEVVAAEEGRLPDLVRLEDIRGDLHTHTTMSDGGLSMEEMVSAAERRGYGYIALTDHTYGLSVVDGLDDQDLQDYMTRIERINEDTEIRVFSGAEVNVTDHGIDIREETARELDLVVASIHWGFEMNEDEATERLISAVSTDGVDILGHPSGRLINSREGYSYDFERVLEVTSEQGVALELNANPRRLDVPDSQVRRAVEEDVPVSVNTDAHSLEALEYMRYGVWTARRGWAEQGDILNAKSSRELEDWLSSG